MKISVETEKLKNALNKILSVIDKKISKPILTNCLIKAHNNKLEIVATDLEVSAKVLIDAEISSKASFCINSKNIFEILRELPSSVMDMNIIEDENLLNLTCKNIKYSLLIASSEDYPQINFENTGNAFELEASELTKIIAKTNHAVSTDETRTNLNGIYLQEVDSKLRAVAIDGHRLALLDTYNFNSSNSSLEDGVIVPRKGINELKKIADTYSNQRLKISVDESFLNLSVNDEYNLSVRLIAREYPRYQTVIPSKTTYRMKVEKNELLNAVRRIKILSNEKTNGIKLDIHENKLVVSANEPSLGNAREEISAYYEGQDISIGFNAKYMIETLSVLEGEEIIFEFNNELSPVVCKSEVENNFIGIIMPLKL